MFSNVDTLTIDKLNELKTRLKYMDTLPDLIALQEVKAKHFRFERSLAEYHIEGYEILGKKTCTK